jgi:hypothetical protein
MQIGFVWFNRFCTSYLFTCTSSRVTCSLTYFSPWVGLPVTEFKKKNKNQKKKQKTIKTGGKIYYYMYLS